MSDKDEFYSYTPIDYDEVMRLAKEGRRQQSIAMRKMIVSGFKSLARLLHVDGHGSAKAAR